MGGRRCDPRGARAYAASCSGDGWFWFVNPDGIGERAVEPMRVDILRDFAASDYAQRENGPCAVLICRPYMML